MTRIGIVLAWVTSLAMANSLQLHYVSPLAHGQSSLQLSKHCTGAVWVSLDIGAQDTCTEWSTLYWIEYHLSSQKTVGCHHALATPSVLPWSSAIAVPPLLFCPFFINSLLSNFAFVGHRWGVLWSPKTLPSMSSKLSRSVLSTWPTSWTTVFAYPNRLTTHFLTTIALNWTCYLTPLTQNVSNSTNTLLVWWGGWSSLAALTLRLKSLSYPLTLCIIAKDTLRPHFILCLIWIKSIIHNLSLTWPIPKLTWGNFHNRIGPNSTEK